MPMYKSGNMHASKPFFKHSFMLAVLTVRHKQNTA